MYTTTEETKQGCSLTRAGCCPLTQGLAATVTRLPDGPDLSVDRRHRPDNLGKQSAISWQLYFLP